MVQAAHMMKPKIYVVQFGTGASINLLPLAAGQLYSRLRADDVIPNRFDLPEIIFRRPCDPVEFAAGLENVSVIGFSCFLWNVNVSMAAAGAVRERFPDALIVLGGPSIPKDPDFSTEFIRKYPFIDVIACGEGEEVFASLCRRRLEGRGIMDIPGLIFHDRAGGEILRSGPEQLPPIERLPSPYLDGTFDAIYARYAGEFSGTIWETNRGCPNQCSFCTWGNTTHRGIREKPLEVVKAEIDWIGRRRIRYVAMSDSNFGIRSRDIAIAEYLAETKRAYGFPDFVSVSWVKNSSDKVLRISEILQNAHIGFRVTLALQSLNAETLRAVNRINFKREFYERIRDVYHDNFLYSYIELMLGLPLETYESYMNGLEELMSRSVFDQIYSYPFLLFPNTQVASVESRRRYGIQGKVMEGKYTKSKVSTAIVENMEVVIGTAAMPPEKWLDAFVDGYYTIGLHDDRLAFFVFWYLKRTHGIRITDLVVGMRRESARTPQAYPRVHGAFERLIGCATGVQQKGHSQLIEPEGYGGIPYDPPDGVFLELLLHKDAFYAEFHELVRAFLREKAIGYDESELRDVFVFQRAVMADPKNDREQWKTTLEYDWIEYFAEAFNLRAAGPLRRREAEYCVRDPAPGRGDTGKYLATHFRVRGVPAFNELYDPNGNKVFPPVNLRIAE